MPNIILISNTYPDGATLLRVLNYVLNAGETAGYALDPSHAYRCMQMVKIGFHKQEGVQLLHFIISFSTAEMYRTTTEEVMEIGYQIGCLFQEFQMVQGLHFDSGHIHLHVVMNLVSFRDGHRYSGGLAGFWRLRSMLQERFPQSDVGIYRSIPNSDCNRFSGTEEDDLLRIS